MRPLHEYNRFFAFGCSFTRYFWPTWADIISQEFDPLSYFNYGRSGAGNYFICQRVIEGDLHYKFTNDDLIMIMFSDYGREDRILYQGSNWSWKTPGCIYYQDTYDEGFMKYWDDVHGLTRDLMLVTMLKNYLENRKLEVNMMQMVDLRYGYGSVQEHDFLNGKPKEITNLYNGIFSDLKPSIYDIIFENNWENPKYGPRISYDVPWAENYTDSHAHPKEYLLYLQAVYPDMKLKQSTIDYAHNMHDLIFKTKNINLNPIISPRPTDYSLFNVIY